MFTVGGLRLRGFERCEPCLTRGEALSANGLTPADVVRPWVGRAAPRRATWPFRVAPVQWVVQGPPAARRTARSARRSVVPPPRMLHDPWLDRWLPRVVASAGGRPVLEIGCGNGDDTSTLCEAGLPVIAFDLSDEAVQRARRRAPTARIERRDIRDPFPPDARNLGVVVASLSLHYFPWTETLAIAGRIRDVLAPGGLLLCRLNSTEDRNFGAVGHPEIEADYYLVDGAPKRFFSEPSVRAMFSAGWTVLSLEHFATRKYVRTKALWEAVVQRAA